MKIMQLFGDRVLVKVTDPEEVTSGGLLVKPTDKASSNKGIVEAVGEGTLLQDGTVKPLSIKEGDFVLFNLGTGTVLYEGNEMYRILHVRDILGKLAKENGNNG